MLMMRARRARPPPRAMFFHVASADAEHRRATMLLPRLRADAPRYAAPGFPRHYFFFFFSSSAIAPLPSAAFHACAADRAAPCRRARLMPLFDGDAASAQFDAASPLMLPHFASATVDDAADVFSLPRRHLLEIAAAHAATPMPRGVPMRP